VSYPLVLLRRKKKKCMETSVRIDQEGEPEETTEIRQHKLCDRIMEGHERRGGSKERREEHFHTN